MRHARKFYAANRKKLANFRAAKERKRMERVAREEPMPDTSHVVIPRLRPSGFRVTVDKNWRSRWFCGKQEFGKTLVEPAKAMSTLVFALLIALWEALVRFEVWSPVLVPSPVSVAPPAVSRASCSACCRGRTGGRSPPSPPWVRRRDCRRSS